MDKSVFGGITYTQFGATRAPSLICVTGMVVTRCRSSASIAVCVGSMCWTTTKAMPQSTGTCCMKDSSASSPPAEAPMPTIGK
ncbi:MAG TPA: hypothetical protein VIK25_16235 [Gemmatimonadaceae bacterium]